MKIRTIINLIRNIRKYRYLYFLFTQDMQRYLNYSCFNATNPECLATRIRLLSHAIEKGMSLPNCRVGFGQDKIKELIQLCDKYSAVRNHKDSQAIEVAYAVIRSYIALESKEGVDLSFIPPRDKEQVVKSNIKAGTSNFSGNIDPQYFQQVALHRHSLRYFSKKQVNQKDIQRAVAIAQTAPSACNRQPIHIYAVTDTHKINQIMQLHSGIRTLTNPTVIFIVTGDRTLYQGEYERNTVYVDGGIFTMNLLYALDSVGIASCPAIWGNIPSDDAALQAIVGIEPNHTIVNLIVAGYYPNYEYKAATSSRRETSQILHIV